MAAAQAVVAAIPPAASAATPPKAATFRAADGSGTGPPTRSGDASPDGERSARRATASAAVVMAAAPSAAPTSGLANRPVPRVTGRSSWGATNGAIRLRPPMARLARVSLVS